MENEEYDFITQYEEAGKYNHPERKSSIDEDYIIAKCEYIFANHVRGIDSTSWRSKDRYRLLRQYMAGKQEQSIYQKMFYGDLQNSANGTMNSAGIDVGGVSGGKFNFEEWSRKALTHINWQIMSPMPKIMNKIHSSYYGDMYDINIECIDENSIAEQDQKKWKAWVQSQSEMIEFMKQLAQMSNMPYKEPEKKFKTIDELELHEANGGFKLNAAKEGEKVIKDSWNVANGTELCEKIIDDLASLNIAGFKVEYSMTER